MNAYLVLIKEWAKFLNTVPDDEDCPPREEIHEFFYGEQSPG